MEQNARADPHTKRRMKIESNGDWIWLHDKMTNQVMMASEFEILSRKFAVLFKDLGMGSNEINRGLGDVVHFVVGNHNYLFPAIGGLWILGGSGSLALSHKHNGTQSHFGDIEVATDADSIYIQAYTINVKAVICCEETAKFAQEAVQSIKEDFNRDVHLFSFGDVEGMENILTKLEHIDEKLAPQPMEIPKLADVVFKGPYRMMCCMIEWPDLEDETESRVTSQLKFIEDFEHMDVWHEGPPVYVDWMLTYGIKLGLSLLRKGKTFCHNVGKWKKYNPTPEQKLQFNKTVELDRIELHGPNGWCDCCDYDQRQQNLVAYNNFIKESEKNENDHKSKETPVDETDNSDKEDGDIEDINRIENSDMEAKDSESDDEFYDAKEENDGELCEYEKIRLQNIASLKQKFDELRFNQLLTENKKSANNQTCQQRRSLDDGGGKDFEKYAVPGTSSMRTQPKREASITHLENDQSSESELTDLCLDHSDWSEEQSDSESSSDDLSEEQSDSEANSDLYEYSQPDDESNLGWGVYHDYGPVMDTPPVRFTCEEDMENYYG